MKNHTKTMKQEQTAYFYEKFEELPCAFKKDKTWFKDIYSLIYLNESDTLLFYSFDKYFIVENNELIIDNFKMKDLKYYNLFEKFKKEELK